MVSGGREQGRKHVVHNAMKRKFTLVGNKPGDNNEICIEKEQKEEQSNMIQHECCNSDRKDNEDNVRYFVNDNEFFHFADLMHLQCRADVTRHGKVVITGGLEYGSNKINTIESISQQVVYTMKQFQKLKSLSKDPCLEYIDNCDDNLNANIRFWS